MRSWLISIWFCAAFGVTAQVADGAESIPRPATESGGDTIAWGETNVVASPGVWGRMIQLTNRHWLSVSTRLARTNSALQLHFSTDNARQWSLLGEVADGRRFLDNGELIQLPDGAVLLTGRSLIEAESYRLPVYRSTDAGRTWNYLSNIDANEGAPGTFQARGLWEPHFYVLADGRLAVTYANEKHASKQPAFSQVCSMRISPDLGKSWGDEIILAAEPGGGKLRPGMPVVERMANGGFIAVYEVVEIGDADVFYKLSADGEHWPDGLGTRIADHHAGPWVTSLCNGWLLLTSCANVVSRSDDFGRTWQPVNPPAWDFGPGKVFTWPAIYQTGANEVAVMISRRGVQLRFGTFGELTPDRH